MAISQLYPPTTTTPPTVFDFAKSRCLDPRITFTRASTGTFVGSNGQIQTALTDQPRITYDPVSGKCLGLLVEEARTNLLVRSEEFDNASWNSAAGARSVAANAAVAPDGQTTADRVTADGTSAVHLVSQSVTLTNTPHTYSVFAKAGANSFIQLRAFAAFGGQFANFDLSTGTTGITGSGATSSSITAFPNGWYRCSMVFTPTATTGSVATYLVTNASAPPNQANTLTTDVLLWGAQLEVGSFPTSYIPTTSSTATRAADIATITGANFSWWYRQDEGTLFVRSIPVNTAGNGIVGFDDGTSAERWRVGHSGITAAGLTMVDNNSVTASPFSPSNSWSLNTAGSAAGAIQLNNTNVAANGLIGTLDTSCTLPTVTQMTIGTAQVVSPNNGPIAHIIYYPQRLSDTYLQQLTK